MRSGTRERHTRRRVAGAFVIASLLVCAACDPGWVAPVAGSGDGSGTVPGAVSVPAGEISFGSPWAAVDLGARGFLVYDGDNCTITLMAHGQGTRFAGDGTCGDTGDGGPAVDASLRVGATPLGAGLQVDPQGNVLFVSTEDTGSVRRIDAANGVITTVFANPEGFVTGLSAEADGVVTYVVQRPIEVTDGDTMSTRNISEVRRVDAGGDRLVASLDGVIAGLPGGLFRLGPDRYVTFGGDTNGSMLRVEIDHGTVTTAPVDALPGVIPATLGPDGSVYGFEWDSSTDLLGTRVLRIAPDGSVDVIAGTGIPDPGTHRQTGTGLDLDLRAQALASTRGGNLLIASGHVVYDLLDPAHAPSYPALRLGAPLNFFGGSGDLVDMPPVPTAP